MKTYMFKFVSRPCEFKNDFVSVTYELFGEKPGTTEEFKELTWPEAQAYFKEFVEKTVGPMAFYMTCKADRLPAGYKAFKRTIYKKGPENV